MRSGSGTSVAVAGAPGVGVLALGVGGVVGRSVGLTTGVELAPTVVCGRMLGVTLAQPSKPSATAAIKQYEIRRETTIDPIVGGARTHAKCHLAEPVGAA